MQKQEKRNFKLNFLAHIKGEAKASIKTSFVHLILPHNQGKNNTVGVKALSSPLNNTKWACIHL